jgi:acylphosphatase
VNDSPIERLHAVVEGEVQGVGYRVFVVRSAGPLAVRGWVRNRFDGSVEVLAEGQRASLEVLLRDLRAGPRASTVRDVRVEWLSATLEFPDFRVRYV